jgi:hypothetical protein
MAASAARSPISRVLTLLLVIVAGGLLLFARGMDRDLNHDEHQFLAPGALLQRQGAVPYRDYPMFHVPNLTYIYGSLLQFTDHYVLAAKSLSVIASLIVLGVIAVRVARTNSFGSAAWGAPMIVCVVALLLTDPLFLWTQGKTWNHELPTMFLVVAFLCQIVAIQQNSVLFSAFAGFLVSLSIGTRMTVLPAVIPFGASFFLVPNATAARRFALLGAFILAGIIGATPSIFSFLSNPDAFLFCNLECPRLRLADLTDSRAAETATWWRKLRYFVKEIVLIGRRDGEFRGSLLLFFAFGALSIPVAWRWLRDRTSGGALDLRRFPAAFAAVLVFFVALGAAFPLRYQYQHWFIVVPFLALAIAEALPFVPPGARSWKGWGVAALAVASVVMNGWVYAEPLRHTFTPSEWFGVRLHEYAVSTRAHIPEGKVLTLAPTYPIEAGLPTYPEFAIGPFAWRLAHLVDPEVRRRFHVIAPADLEEFLAKDPPAAILTGVEEDDLEAPLIDYAKAHGYQQVKLKKRRDLWVRPKGD